MTTVRLLALWEGWCDPCHVERPLALTEHGDHGLRAWLRGVGAENYRLVLTCEVCGQWQQVPLEEADDVEPPPFVLRRDLAALPGAVPATSLLLTMPRPRRVPETRPRLLDLAPRRQAALSAP